MIHNLRARKGWSFALALSPPPRNIDCAHRRFSSRSSVFRIADEVKQAIAEGRPIVALESTIYTHGFPYPDNLSLATRLESLVREHGAVPATIGILDGVARVGLEANDLMRLVSPEKHVNPLKISRRDLGFACGLRDVNGNLFSGGTTVSATMVLAHLAGIKIFATGGLGGVHRGVESTMDVSADLTELGRTPLSVISSGCKSFLDIPKTLEFLETEGVAVATFVDGRSGKVDFPAFYSRDSGIRSPMTVRDATEAARVIYAHSQLGLQSGLLFANPIPTDHSIPNQDIESSVQLAIEESQKAGATGAASTPYILGKIKELTGSKSLEANRALVESNVIKGAEVAKALIELEAENTRLDFGKLHSNVIGPAATNFTDDGVSKGLSLPSTTSKAPALSDQCSEDGEDGARSPKGAQVIIAGSIAIDLACDFAVQQLGSAPKHEAFRPELYTSNPATIRQSLGGVGSNVARAAHLMGANVHLCSVVGNDLAGKSALEALHTANLSVDGIKILTETPEYRTAQYIAVNDANRDLYLAMADMSILESTEIGDQGISTIFNDLWLPQLQHHKPSHLILDANWSPSQLASWMKAGRENGTHITFEPVSRRKGANIFRLPRSQSLGVFPNHSIDLMTPNTHELAAINAAAREQGAFDESSWWQVIDALGIPHSGARTQLSLATTGQLVDSGVPQQTIQLLPYMPSICTKLGSQGVLVTRLIPADDPRLNDGAYAPYILSRCANGTESTLGVGGVYMRLFPASEEVRSLDIVSVNGVGDTLAGALVAGLAKRGKNAKIEDLVDIAQRAAVLTLKSKESVSPGLGTLSMLL